MVTGQDILEQAKKAIGVPYKWGAKPSPTMLSWPAVDCSGLTELAAALCDIDLPTGSINQYRLCHREGTLIPLEEAKRTPGALVFIFGSDPLTTWPSSRHVGFSVGDGTTIDARKPAVDIYDWNSRNWGFGALIPGVTYGAEMKDYEIEAIKYLQDRGIFTEYTTDEPGEIDEAVTVRLLAVVLWRLARLLEPETGTEPGGAPQ
jgi:cell wall-associated NlpC family hydrolase